MIFMATDRKDSKKRVLAAGRKMYTFSEFQELGMAVAPYLPEVTQEMVPTADFQRLIDSQQLIDFQQFIGETGPSGVTPIAETSIDMQPPLQEETLPTGSPALLDTPTDGNIFPIREISAEKIFDNLIRHHDYNQNQLDLNEMTRRSHEIFELKIQILNKLRTLARQANAPSLWDSPGADELITHLNGSEYKISFLRTIKKSLERKGAASTYYFKFWDERNSNLADPAVPRNR
jgi:hypothetical protein